MKKALKEIPKFKTEADEIEFWDTHDGTDYFDTSKAVRATFPNLKPSTETISIRLSASLLTSIKNLANKNDVPYQSLMKMMLAEKVKEAYTPASQPIRGLRARRQIPKQIFEGFEAVMKKVKKRPKDS